MRPHSQVEPMNILRCFEFPTQTTPPCFSPWILPHWTESDSSFKSESQRQPQRIAFCLRSESPEECLGNISDFPCTAAHIHSNRKQNRPTSQSQVRRKRQRVTANVIKKIIIFIVVFILKWEDAILGTERLSHSLECALQPHSRRKWSWSFHSLY